MVIPSDLCLLLSVYTYIQRDRILLYSLAYLEVSVVVAYTNAELFRLSMTRPPTGSPPDINARKLTKFQDSVGDKTLQIQSTP